MSCRQIVCPHPSRTLRGGRPVRRRAGCGAQWWKGREAVLAAIMAPASLTPLKRPLSFKAVLTRIAAALLLAPFLALSAQADAVRDGDRPSAPRRIISLNLCADELLLRLVPREHILSITSLAQDPANSSVAKLAVGIPTNRGLAEEIIPLDPDLVIAGAFTTRNTVSTLRRFGIKVLDMGVPGTLDEAYAQIHDMGEALGARKEADEMIAGLKAAIPAETSLQPPLPRAVVVRPNGFTAGRNTMADDLIRRAGLDNVASRLSPDRLGQLSLEEIVSARPQVLILDTDADAPPSMAGAIMQHPALMHAAIGANIVSVPTRLWACAGPQLAEAYARLAAGAQTSRERERTQDPPAALPPSHESAQKP